MLINEPHTLTETKLTFVKCKSTSSTVSANTPAGSEYIIDETFPAKILPTTVFIIKTENPYLAPKNIDAKRINILESPSLAPGKIIGGNRKRRKDIFAAAMITIKV